MGTNINGESRTGEQFPAIKRRFNNLRDLGDLSAVMEFALPGDGVTALMREMDITYK
jgi:hypothetical protein